MADVTDQLYRIIQYLPGLEDGLQLGCLILVHQVFIQVKAGSSQQGSGIIMKIGCESLSFLLLKPDGSIQQDFLLFMFQVLQFQLVSDNLSLMEYDKKDQANGQYQHAQGTQEEYEGNA